jgi:hypothetical protein
MYTVFTNPGVYIPAAQNRVALLIGSHGTQTVILGTESELTYPNGLAIPPNTQALQLTLETHGDIVRKGLWCVSGGNSNIGVLEVFQDEY